MKTFLLSIRLFWKRLLANCVLGVELAAIAIITVIVGNIFQYSQSCIDVFATSNNRILFCSNPEPPQPDAITMNSRNAYIAKIIKLQKQYPFIKGYSTLNMSDLAFDTESITNLVQKQEGISTKRGAHVLLYDNATIESMHFPLSNGKWLGTSLVNGKIPCVIGGIYASRFHVGDTLPGYTFQTDDKGTLRTGPKQDFIVTGVQALPQLTPDTQFSSSITDRASAFFDDMTNYSMFLIAPDQLYKGARTSGIESQSSFLYLDRSATSEQIEQVRTEMGRGFTELDTEMIAAEKTDKLHTLQTLLPFLITFFIVLFLGLISMSMLTTMKNLRLFKIYYLTGCPRKEILQMLLWYMLFYPILAGTLFTIVFTVLRHMEFHSILVLRAYLIVQPQAILLILLMCAAVIVCSLLAPYLILRKNDLAALLRKE